MIPGPPGILLVRADASPTMGTGHWMRCLALAQAWIDSGGAVVLAAAEGVEALEARFLAEGVEIVPIAGPPGSAADATATVRAARAAAAQWVALDGYDFDGAFRSRLKDEGGASLLCLDDDGRNADASTDIVLNQNPSAGGRRYMPLAPGAQRLLGRDFVLLRREFGPWRGKRRQAAPRARRVLVTLGGGDTGTAAERVVAALKRLPMTDLAVVFLLPATTGSRNDALAHSADARFQFVAAADEVVQFMVSSDVAVAAGGTTSLELAFMGVPALLLELAPNQQPNVLALHESGAARALGPVGNVTVETIARDLTDLLGSPVPVRAVMSVAGQALIDGHGVRRVLAAMAAHEALTVRPATSADAERLFDWANDPHTRAMSFDPRPIEWDAHVRWLENVLSAPDRRLFVVEWREGGTNRPFGQVRLDADGTVSFSLAPDWRGRGLAAPALRKVLGLPQAAPAGGKFVAHIKPDNEFSRRTFRQAGFALSTNDATKEQWVMESANV